MVSSSTVSRMVRRPRAPVLRARARRATSPRASARNSSSTPSIANSLRYCRVMAFFGSVSTRTSSSSSSSSSTATIGRRPTNSGIRP